MTASISAEFPPLLDKRNIYVCVILYLYHILSSKVNPRGRDFFCPYLQYLQTTLFPFNTNYVYFLNHGMSPKYVITD